MSVLRHAMMACALLALAACEEEAVGGNGAAMASTAVAGQTVAYPNGVEVHERIENGQRSAIGMDHSRGGAVLCARELYILMAGTLTPCVANLSPVVAAEMARSLERIDDFVVANSPDPVDREALHDDTRRKLRQAEEIGWHDKEKGCLMMHKALEKFPDRSPEAWRDAIREQTDLLLAEPRVPVMNPCL